MIWFPIIALTVLTVGLLVVVRDAVTHKTK